MIFSQTQPGLISRGCATLAHSESHAGAFTRVPSKRLHSSTPVYPSWDGNFWPRVLRHEHTKGKGRTRPPSVPTATGHPSGALGGRTRPLPVPQRGKAAGPRRAAQRSQWAHAHAARRGRRLDESESSTRAHRPGKRGGGARAARRGRAPVRLRRAPAERRSDPGPRARSA